MPDPVKSGVKSSPLAPSAIEIDTLRTDIEQDFVETGKFTSVKDMVTEPSKKEMESYLRKAGINADFKDMSTEEVLRYYLELNKGYLNNMIESSAKLNGLDISTLDQTALNNSLWVKGVGATFKDIEQGKIQAVSASAPEVKQEAAPVVEKVEPKIVEQSTTAKVETVSANAIETAPVSKEIDTTPVQQSVAVETDKITTPSRSAAEEIKESDPSVVFGETVGKKQPKKEVAQKKVKASEKEIETTGLTKIETTATEPKIAQPDPNVLKNTQTNVYEVEEVAAAPVEEQKSQDAEVVQDKIVVPNEEAAVGKKAESKISTDAIGDFNFKKPATTTAEKAEVETASVDTESTVVTPSRSAVITSEANKEFAELKTDFAKRFESVYGSDIGKVSLDLDLRGASLSSNPGAISPLGEVGASWNFVVNDQNTKDNPDKTLQKKFYETGNPEYLKFKNNTAGADFSLQQRSVSEQLPQEGSPQINSLSGVRISDLNINASLAREGNKELIGVKIGPNTEENPIFKADEALGLNNVSSGIYFNQPALVPNTNLLFLGSYQVKFGSSKANIKKPELTISAGASAALNDFSFDQTLSQMSSDVALTSFQQAPTLYAGATLVGKDKKDKEGIPDRVASGSITVKSASDAGGQGPEDDTKYTYANVSVAGAQKIGKNLSINAGVSGIYQDGLNNTDEVTKTGIALANVGTSYSLPLNSRSDLNLGVSATSGYDTQNKVVPVVAAGTVEYNLDLEKVDLGVFATAGVTNTDNTGQTPVVGTATNGFVTTGVKIKIGK